MTIARPTPILGVYEKPFWEAVRNRELRLQRCDNGHFRFPPGPRCPRCMSAAFSWEKVSGRGKLVSWTVFHRPYFKEMPVPYTVVCGELQEGPLLVADLAGPDDGPLRAGMPLDLRFFDATTKAGDFVLYQWSRPRHGG